MRVASGGEQSVRRPQDFGQEAHGCSAVQSNTSEYTVAVIARASSALVSYDRGHNRVHADKATSASAAAAAALAVVNLVQAVEVQ